MSGFESFERQDHDERQAAPLRLVKIRATQVVAAARATQFAAMVYELAGTVGAEANHIASGSRTFARFIDALGLTAHS